MRERSLTQGRSQPMQIAEVDGSTHGAQPMQIAEVAKANIPQQARCVRCKTHRSAA